MEVFISIVCVICSYLIGCVNPAFLFARKKGFDIRERGSHNAGGSNAVITMGAKTGVLVILIDMAKAFLAVMLTKLITGDVYSPVCSSAAVILGHMFPFQMKFRGGKGLACFCGSILALSPLTAVVLILVELAILLWQDYIVILTLSLSVLFPVLYAVQLRDYKVFLIFMIATVPIWIRHIDNFKKLAAGTETKCFTFLRARDEEIERTQVDAPRKNELSGNRQEETGK